MSRSLSTPRIAGLCLLLLTTLTACSGEVPAPPGPGAAPAGPPQLPVEQIVQLVGAVRQLQSTVAQLGGAAPTADAGPSQEQLKRRMGMEVEAVLAFLEDDQTEIPGKDSLGSIIDLVTSGDGQFAQSELDQLDSDFQSFLQEVEAAVGDTGALDGALPIGGPGPGGPGPGGPGPGGPGPGGPGPGGPKPGPPRP